MYSFCVSGAFGAFIIIGGIIGFLKRGSKISLIMSLLFGGPLAVIGYIVELLHDIINSLITQYIIC